MPDLSWRDAIISVLKESKEPMHYTDISEAIIEKKMRVSFGATPPATVNANITMSFKEDGADSPFVRIGRGLYYLRDSLPEQAAQLVDKGSLENEETGLINSFGMYWSRVSVHWTTTPAILGEQQPGSKRVDFCQQRGVYLLHDGRAVVYVGRTTDQPLGALLRQHTVDRLDGRWDRFTWFGVYPVLENGTLDTDAIGTFNLEMLIITMEALLIEGLEPPQNRKRGDDFRAVEFLQVQDPAIQRNQILQLMDDLKKKL